MSRYMVRDTSKCTATMLWTLSCKSNPQIFFPSFSLPLLVLSAVAKEKVLAVGSFCFLKMSSSQIERIKDLRKNLKRKRLEISTFLDDVFYSHCRSILVSAIAMDKDKLFYDNPSKLPGYDDVIRRPVYWRLIEKKLNLYMYTSAGEFILDMRNLFDNCFEYNQLSSAISAAARGIEVHAEDLFVKVLGEEPPSCDEIRALGASLEKSTASEVWKTICFYENIDKKVSDHRISINPSKFSCACQRRMLQILRQHRKNRQDSGAIARQPPFSSRPLLSVRSSNQIVPTAGSSELSSSSSIKTPNEGGVTSVSVNSSSAMKQESAQKKNEEKFTLDAVPQNTRCDFSVRVVSPVGPLDHEDPISEEEEDISFADA